MEAEDCCDLEASGNDHAREACASTGGASTGAEGKACASTGAEGKAAAGTASAP